MMARMKWLARLRDDRRGSMMIETAIVTPVLLLLSMGAFQVSSVVARQTELQDAAAEASAIALASPPDTSAKRTVLKNIIMASTGLTTDKVTVTEKFRCGSATTYVDDATTCAGSKVGHFILIQLDDTYTPVWTQWGFSRPLQFNVDRYVMIKQA